MEKIYNAREISRQLLDAVEQFNKYDKKSRTFGTDHELFVAEIHLINFIGCNGNCCISDIAKSIQVTKGAVSQMVKKLENKGYLTKRADSANKTRIIVQLTSKGSKAFNEHCRYHEELDDIVSDAVQKYNGQQRSIIYEFLNEMQRQWK